MPNPMQVPANVNGQNLNRDAAASPIGQAFAPKGVPSVLNQTAQAVEQRHKNPPTQDPDYQGPVIQDMTPDRLKLLMAADADKRQRQRAAMQTQDSEQQHTTYPATE